MRANIGLIHEYIPFPLDPTEVPFHLDLDYCWGRQVSTYHCLLVGSSLCGRLRVRKYALAEGAHSEEGRVLVPCFLVERVLGHTIDGGEVGWPLEEYPRFRTQVLRHIHQQWVALEVAMEGGKK